MGHVTRSSLSALVGLALLSAGCGSSSSNAHAVAPPPRGTAHLAMKVLEFTPAAVDVRVGQRVVWRNDDTSPHNVTYVSGPRFKSSGTLHAGGTFSLKVRSPGTIHYVCTLHPWMKATIVVSR
jgi:plastocyanin